MKRWWLLYLLVAGVATNVDAQETEDLNTLEEMQGTEEGNDLDAVAQYRYACSKRPLNINLVTEQELFDLYILESWQVQQFLQYRNKLGSFISIYELQSVPGWELQLIKRVIPYLACYPNSLNDWKATIRNGEGANSLWIRGGIQWPLSVYKTRSWTGSEYSSQIRYRYTMGDRIDLGIIADKDAGEPFLKGKNRWGFDFYSGHLFLKGKGMLKAIALGDYVVNLGEGLLQWQSPAFRRSTGITGIKRQGEMLRSYRSAAEFNFYRGVALNFKKGKWEGLIFYSARQLSSNQVYDSMRLQYHVTSIAKGGYHRTDGELSDKNNVRFRASGASWRFKNSFSQFSVNLITHSFSVPVQNSDKPYQLFDFRGSHAVMTSADHSIVWRNMHFFGEMGVDQNKRAALVQGVMAALDRKLDVLFLYRYVAPGFTSFSGNAYTDNVLPENEQGWCLGFEYRPNSRWLVSGNIDQGRSLWVGFQDRQLTNYGRFRGQLSWIPDKKTSLRVGYQGNSFSEGLMKQMVTAVINVEPETNWHLLGRWDWCRAEKEGTRFFGYSTFVESRYRKPSAKVGFTIHTQFYSIDDYESRIYVSESGLTFARDLFLAQGRGLRNFIVLTFKESAKSGIKNIHNISLSIKLAQTFALKTQKTDFQSLIEKDFTTYSLQMQAICGF